MGLQRLITNRVSLQWQKVSSSFFAVPVVKNKKISFFYIFFHGVFNRQIGKTTVHSLHIFFLKGIFSSFVFEFDIRRNIRKHNKILMSFTFCHSRKKILYPTFRSSFYLVASQIFKTHNMNLLSRQIHTETDNLKIQQKLQS